LGQALRDWWETESQDWDALVTGETPVQPDPEIDLWDNLPVIDSKAVARTSPFFEKFLGLALDVKLIRAGGYKSIEDMIDHLVSLMDQAAQNKTTTKQEAR
jgi:hypothetical protein